MTRKYEMKRRARRQEETRQRITEATVELHQALGPAKTTISAIAERAGVQRLTVYVTSPMSTPCFLLARPTTKRRTLRPIRIRGLRSPTLRIASEGRLRRPTPTTVAPSQ